MKRSRSLTLTRMRETPMRAVLLAGTTVALTACEEPTAEVSAFRTVDQCVASQLFDLESCEVMLQDALQDHQAQAPRYAEQALCEEEFGLGACGYSEAAALTAEGSASSGYWSPFFTGWITGQIADEVADEIGDAFDKKRKKKYGYVQPFYRVAGTGGYQTLSGGTLKQSGNGKIVTQAAALVSKPAPTAPKVMTRTTISSRGGFAGSSRFAGGFGG